jgi:hypothetical protein
LNVRFLGLRFNVLYGWKLLKLDAGMEWSFVKVQVKRFRKGIDVCLATLDAYNGAVD